MASKQVGWEDPNCHEIKTKMSIYNLDMYTWPLSPNVHVVFLLCLCYPARFVTAPLPLSSLVAPLTSPPSFFDLLHSHDLPHHSPTQRTINPDPSLSRSFATRLLIIRCFRPRTTKEYLEIRRTSIVSYPSFLVSRFSDTDSPTWIVY